MASGHHASGQVDPNLNCQPQETYHVYYGSGTIRAGVWHLLRPTTGITQFNDGNLVEDCGSGVVAPPFSLLPPVGPFSFAPQGGAFAGSCGTYPWSDPITYPLPGSGWCDGVPGDFDYDIDYAIGGGFFPGGPWATDPDCDYGYFPHHGAVPEIDDVAYPLLSGVGANPAFTWGADDTTLLGAGSGKVQATDPADQQAVGGDGLQCLTTGSITPNVDADDWLQLCYGDASTGTVCDAPTPPRTYPAAGGDGGFTAFTLTTVSVDTGRLDWVPDPLNPGGYLHDHGGYDPNCDPFLNPFNVLNPCHATEAPKELFITLAGTLTS